MCVCVYIHWFYLPFTPPLASPVGGRERWHVPSSRHLRALLSACGRCSLCFFSLLCACVCRCRGCFLCRCVLCACDLLIGLHIPLTLPLIPVIPHLPVCGSNTDGCAARLCLHPRSHPRAHLPFTAPVLKCGGVILRVVVCGFVLVVSCVVLFLLCVCVCDLFCFLHLPFTPPIHTSHSHLMSSAGALSTYSLRCATVC